MKKIVVLGAGRSAPYLIRHLIELAPERDWQVTVGDADIEVARQRVGNRANAEAVEVDASSERELGRAVEGADVVANVLAPRFQASVARHCVEAGAHMVSVSYLSPEARDLEKWARDREVLLLGEMGLDPGIDHMMAADAVRRTISRGGRITAFRSFGSGVPAPDSPSNPLRYLVTWNPWNVATSGAAGAQYLLDGEIRMVPHERLFLHTWPVDVEGVGLMEGYPNRDSLGYLEHFDLDEVTTMIRGTLRWPGFCETWDKLVKLGLATDTLRIPRLAERSPREVVGMLLPVSTAPENIEASATLFLGLNPTGQLIENLRFLGLFDDQPTGCAGDTVASMLSHLLQTRLAPNEDSRDMVALVHEMDVEYPDSDLANERVIDTMVDFGVPLEMSAMAKTVGLPTALAVEMILAGELSLTGCQLPTHPSICDPILSRLKAAGLRFTERVEPLE